MGMCATPSARRFLQPSPCRPMPTPRRRASNGGYLLAVPPGTYDVTANPNNLNALYIYATLPAVTVALGAVTNTANFTLFQGGRVNAFCSRDGINPLPGVAF